jgi:HEAT repeat protein
MTARTLALVFLAATITAAALAGVATMSPELATSLPAASQKKAEVALTPTADNSLPSRIVDEPRQVRAATGMSRMPVLPADVKPESLRRLAGPTALDLEGAVEVADLILVVRLIDVTESRIVHGGKQEVVTQQYRFEPIQTLKGVYARDALLMTDQDLRLYQFAHDGSRIEPGQLLLLLLGRSGPGWLNCNEAGALGQSIPKLADANDPLLRTVEALIRVTQEPDRANRVKLLTECLATVDGRASLPLLASLRRRAVLAARDSVVTKAVADVLDQPGPIAREQAANTLAELLRARSGHGEDEKLLNQRLALLLDDQTFADFRARLALIEALGGLAQLPLPDEAGLPPAQSLAERVAWLRAFATPDGAKSHRAAILHEADALLLDATEEMVRAVYGALSQVDVKVASDRLAQRAKARLMAGLAIPIEIELLGKLDAEHSTPILIELSTWPLSPDERQALASASVKLADPQLVPVLANLLDPSYSDIRDAAFRALEKIDTEAAAQVIWPHLGEEGDLSRKLRLAAFLGRHGFRGGYPFAIEHLSDPSLRDLAVDALGDIKHPDAIAELRRIWERSNDLSWNAAAMRGLARLGDDGFASSWLEIARDPANPLAPAALRALADLKSREVLPAIRSALDARGDDLVVAAAQASAVLLKDNPDAETLERLAALVADRQASQVVRWTALETLITLRAPQLGPALEASLRDASIEGSALMGLIENSVRKLASAPGVTGD